MELAWRRDRPAMNATSSRPSNVDNRAEGCLTYQLTRYSTSAYKKSEVIKKRYTSFLNTLVGWDKNTFGVTGSIIRGIMGKKVFFQAKRVSSP